MRKRNKLNKGRNLFQLLDLSVEKLEENKKKNPLENLEYVSFETIFNEKGILDYALFKTRQKEGNRVRILRLFHVKSVSNEIREEINNEEAFRNILKQFGKDGISFVTLYAYKPGENLIISYGVLSEGPMHQRSRIEKETELYIRTLEDKFRNSYANIEIEPISVREEWLFEGFYYDQLTVVRGVPQPDSGAGRSAGTTPYRRPVMVGQQVSETLLKGMTANKQGKLAMGHPFLLYTVLDKLSYDDIKQALQHIQNTLGKLNSSKEIGVSENENFSFPLLFGFGFGEMMGQTDTASVGNSASEAMTSTTGNTETVSASESTARGTSESYGSSNSTSEAVSKSTSEGNGGNAGVGALIVNSGTNYSVSENEGITDTTGDSTTNTTGHSFAKTDTAGNSQASSASQSTQQSTGVSQSQSLANSQSENKSSNLSGGVSGGDGSGISRHQIDHFFLFAIDVFMKNEWRFQQSLRDGMFDYRMFILTQDEQAKVAAEEFVKQSYIDHDSPFPVRVVDVEKEEEKQLKRYVKSMAKPLALEVKPAIPEKYRYSTYITPREATAFDLPQENLPGYLSSFDPVPQSIAYLGKMEKGAVIGNQINGYLNVESPTTYMIPKEKLSHIGIFGATNMGKTVFVQRFIASVHNEYETNFLLFDWTRNHRSLIGHLKDKNKFRYNSFETGYFPLKINLVVPPPGVSMYVWNPVVAELLCYSMGLGDRSFRIITKVLKKTQERALARNYVPTMEHFVRELGHEYGRRVRQHGGEVEDGDDSVSAQIRSQTKFMPSNEQQSFGSMIERMEEWLDKNHPVYQSMCGTGPFMTIDQLVAGDFVHLVECGGLPSEVKQFVINGITAAIFHYCKSRDVKLKKPSYILFEEAHTVLKQQTGNEPLNISETIFETINREARNYNLLIGYICQSPELLPPLIFDNLPMRVVFQIPDTEGKTKIISAGGKDPMRLDVNLVKWLSRQPMGTCLIRLSKFHKIQDAEFVAVKVHMLPTDELSNQLFKTLYMKNKKKRLTC